MAVTPQTPSDAHGSASTATTQARRYEDCNVKETNMHEHRHAALSAAKSQVDPSEAIFGLNSKTAHESQAQGEPLYHALAAHQVSQEDWEFHEILVKLQCWKDIFPRELQFPVPPVALCIGATRSNCYGYFRPGHNDFGFRREIKINRSPLLGRIQSGEFWRALGTLLHELLHAWQDTFGTPPKSNYHNKEFQTKAAQYGLIVDSRGVTDYAPDTPFFRVLEKYGVEVPKLPTPWLRPAGRSKLKKWSCGCTNVRVAVAHFRALCLACGNEFKRMD